jgi:hypothetical protein
VEILEEICQYLTYEDRFSFRYLFSEMTSAAKNDISW